MDINKQEKSKSRNIINIVSIFFSKYINRYLENNDKNEISSREINDISENTNIVIHKIYDNNLLRITDDNMVNLIDYQKLYTDLSRKLNKLNND
jgi:hypothetical protein